MIFQSLIKSLTWKEIPKRLIELYPDQEGNLDLYEKVFNNLLSLPIEKDEQNMQIRISFIEDSLESWYDIDGYVENEPIGYSLQYLKWEIWLGLEIYELTMNQYSPLDIVCHCLWEMTFSGFTQEEIQKNYQTINTVDKDELETIVINSDFNIQIPKNLDALTREKIIQQFSKQMQK